MIPRIREAMSLFKDRYRLELVDLRTLSPLDEEAVLTSAKKTGRVLIVHEAPKSLGLGAEIAAIISERALDYLKAPIVRVTGYDVPMPLARTESYDIPSVERIASGIEKIMNYAA
jgi:pyruvate/2-oxoglutarate/acetoin dehydrogenase E1 component